MNSDDLILLGENINAMKRYTEALRGAGMEVALKDWLKLAFAERLCSVADFQGYHKHIHFAAKLVNIISAVFIRICHFTPHISA
jgi:hypothetical protein